MLVRLRAHPQAVLVHGNLLQHEGLPLFTPYLLLAFIGFRFRLRVLLAKNPLVSVVAILTAPGSFCNRQT